jgi:hypothetical protein
LTTFHQLRELYSIQCVCVCVCVDLHVTVAHFKAHGLSEHGGVIV